MKTTIIIAIVIGIGIIVWLLSRIDRPASVPIPPNAYLVSVRACDVEDAWVLPITVTTEFQGSNVPIQAVAFSDFTLATFCQWIDYTTRTIRVESEGYQPRKYTLTGKRDIIAVLYRN